MPTVITPSPALLPATINGPQDLVDLRTAASVNQAFQPLADACGYYQESITVRRSLGCADANPRGCTERAKTHDITAGNVVWAPLDWDSSGANVPPEYAFLESTQIKVNDVNAAAAVGRHFLWSLNPVLIQGATLTRVDIVIAGGAGHGALPAMMPALGVVRYDPAASVLVSCYSGNMLDDTSANVAAFEAFHSIQLTPDQNTTIDVESYLYYAVFCNEGHTNAVAELQMRQLRIRMTARRFAAGVNP